MKIWKRLSFTKAKRYHKVLIFKSKFSYMGTHGEYNYNNKFKDIFTMHVCNDFDMWFWWFWWGDGNIFNNMNSECSLEWFKIFFCCGIFIMFVGRVDKFRDVVMFWLWGFCMVARSCLFIDISRRQKEWHPAIFEFEEGCRVLGSWMRDLWWIVMHGN